MPVPRTKVLFLPKWYPDHNDPQNGIFIRKHAQAVALYCDVMVLRVSKDGGLSEKFRIRTNEFEPPEVFSYYRPSSSKNGALRKFINFMRYYRAFNKGWKVLAERSWDPDLVHVHVMVRPGLMAYLKNWPLRKPYLISEHSSEYLNGRFAARSGYFKALVFRIFWRAKAVTAVSEQLASGMKACGLPGKITVIPNVVDLPDLLDGRANIRIHVLTVADLVDDIKNISGIIRAVGALIKEGMDIEYHIIGGGPDEEPLKELASMECPTDRVTFHGRMDNASVLEHLSQTDMVVINSRVETFGLVVAEAIGAGKPVVATRCGGPEMFVNDKTGILVDVEDEAQLKAGIKKVVQEIERYDPMEMRSTLGERYSRATIGAQFHELYKGVLRKN